LRGEYSRADWHFARADGQRDRFERVAACGDREIAVTCDDCGTEGRRIEARCSQARLCVICRGVRGADYRSTIRAGRNRGLRSTSRLRRRGAPGGEWSERFMTLTIPHSGDIERDVSAINGAWPIFRKKLWEFFRREHRLPKHDLAEVRFVRVLEITPGRENDGHAHFHVYLLCPFIPHEFVRHIWGTALALVGYATPKRSLADVLAAADSSRRQQQLARLLKSTGGRPVQDVHWPVIDLRQCYGDVENELVKYLIKDAELRDGRLALVDPKLGARFYKALEGVRTIAMSRGFATREERGCYCEACGSTQVSRRMVKQPERGQADQGAQEPDHD
jgi:hypothetical protein